MRALQEEGDIPAVGHRERGQTSAGINWLNMIIMVVQLLNVDDCLYKQIYLYCVVLLASQDRLRVGAPIIYVINDWR